MCHCAVYLPLLVRAWTTGWRLMFSGRRPLENCFVRLRARSLEETEHFLWILVDTCPWLIIAGFLLDSEITNRPLKINELISSTLDNFSPEIFRRSPIFRQQKEFSIYAQLLRETVDEFKKIVCGLGKITNEICLFGMFVSIHYYSNKPFF